MPRININFAGIIAERGGSVAAGQTLALTAEAQPSTGWRMELRCRWGNPPETVTAGRLSLTDPSGAVAEGRLERGTIVRVTDGDGITQAEQLDLHVAVTGGAGGYAGARGTVHLTGTIAGEGGGTGGSFEGDDGVLLTAELDVDAAGEVWEHPPTEPIPTGPTGTPSLAPEHTVGGGDQRA
jgi:hypothetical protein